MTGPLPSAGQLAPLCCLRNSFFCFLLPFISQNLRNLVKELIKSWYNDSWPVCVCLSLSVFSLSHTTHPLLFLNIYWGGSEGGNIMALLWLEWILNYCLQGLFHSCPDNPRCFHPDLVEVIFQGGKYRLFISEGVISNTLCFIAEVCKM